MNHSFTSIYKDRLVPAAEWFHVNDIMYSKRLLLEKHLLGHDELPADVVRDKLAVHNAQIDSIIEAFETTYLVHEESDALHLFKAKMMQYNDIEHRYVSLEAGTKMKGYGQELEPLFNELNRQIVRLGDIQTKVGKELVQGSEYTMGSASMLNSLQIAMAVVIALLVQILLWTSRSVMPKKPQKFHLN
ncbi:hypothetical protein C900_03715 [Fulvivirga imtechensis AK7]|uniref:Chemotaxis methyl-accepting receptor HlyB-like 4HB MCP domain-containing protein n=2 Tax=Fulvivirga TaxID=396811 RepID=L8JND5_9BACT|nr:hypothetical protein C900_03715 [Fulvivirga imtechensis AK7]